MDNESKLALAALIIGLSALLITTSQLLQQIFGTAEGYRRCQSSVVGPWSRRREGWGLPQLGKDGAIVRVVALGQM